MNQSNEYRIQNHATFIWPFHISQCTVQITNDHSNYFVQIKMNDQSYYSIKKSKYMNLSKLSIDMFNPREHVILNK